MNETEFGTKTKLRFEELTEQIIGAAIEVYKGIGPGLLEAIYDQCLCHEFTLRGSKFERQLTVSAVYKDVKLDFGMIINFNVPTLGHGMVRRVL